MRGQGGLEQFGGSVVDLLLRDRLVIKKQGEAENKTETKKVPLPVYHPQMPISGYLRYTINIHKSRNGRTDKIINGDVSSIT